MEIDPIKVLDLVEEGWQLLHIDTGDELDEMNPGPILYFAKLQEAWLPLPPRREFVLHLCETNLTLARASAGAEPVFHSLKIK